MSASPLKALLAVGLMGLGTFPNPAWAYETTRKQYGDNNKEELTPCFPTRTEEYIHFKQETLTKEYPELSKFTITEDWRTQGLEGKNIPLSKPVILENPITGTTVGVFDRNWNQTFRVSSFFGRSIIRIRLQTVGSAGTPIPVVGAAIRRRVTYGTTSLNSLGIKTKDGYIVVNGCDGVFRVNKDIADALYNYPLVNRKAFILLSNDGSTGLRINEIGPETVKAWKVVYEDWNPEVDGQHQLDNQTPSEEPFPTSPSRTSNSEQDL